MTPQPGRHHTGIPQQAVPLQCCELASRPLGLHYTRVDALADCRYCQSDVRGHSLGHIDTRGSHVVYSHATLTGGHLGGFTHDTPAWHTSYRQPTTGSATAVLTVGLKASRPALHYRRC